jgi:transmembrane sensor
MSDQTPDPADAAWTAAARALAGEGTAEEREAFHREAEAHPGRAELLAALDGALRPLAADARPDVDVEAALAAVMARRDERPKLTVESSPRVRETAPPPSTVRAARWRMPVWLPAAALVVVMIGAALIWRNRDTTPGGGEVQRYATGVGSRRSITLEDGSVVQLGPESWIDVRNDYGRAERAVRMQGEAYFEVKHDAAHPFVVRTAAAEVRDLGTAFTVRTLGVTGARVAVTEGSVELSTASGKGEQVLRAGDRGEVTAEGAVTVERGVATEDDVAWTRGRLVFRDATVPEVADALERWYGITLVVRDPELANRHLTASFGTETADEAVAVVAAALGGQLVRRGDTAAVVPAGASP